MLSGHQPYGLKVVAVGSLELAHVDPVVESPLLEELLVSPLLDDLAVVDDQDHVGPADGAESVGYDEAGPPTHEPPEGLLNLYFRARVDAARGLVQDKYCGVCDQGPGDAYELPLSLADVARPLAELGLVAFGQAPYEAIRVCVLGGLYALLVRGVQPAVPDVIHHGAAEQEHVLEHDSQLPSQVVLLDLPDVAAVYLDAAVVDVVEPREQVHDGRLPRPCGAHEGDGLARLGLQADVLEHRDAWVVLEVHVLELDVSLEVVRTNGVGRVREFGYGVDHLEYTLGSRKG